MSLKLGMALHFARVFKIIFMKSLSGTVMYNVHVDGYRKQHEKNMEGQIDTVQRKLREATATLQTAVGGLSTQVQGLSEKVSVY